MLRIRVIGAIALLAMGTSIALPASPRVEVLSAVGGLPAEIVGVYREPAGYQEVRSGQSLVFDRRAQAVFGVDRDRTTTWKLVDIGGEPGRVLDPTAFDAEPGGSFVVADVPAGGERIQIFSESGRRLGGFDLRGRSVARVTVGSLVLSGIGSLQYTGTSILMSQPETGGLITEFGLAGTPTRTIGALRATGQERDRDLHLALNSGLPLVDPKGGFYFVFVAGVPMFRKYNQQGRLLFERHIEGVELDPLIAALPTVWPRRTGDAGATLPLVVPTVRTATVDPAGNLWIVLVQPWTYVYDPSGHKTRVVQFKGAGMFTPSSLFFASPTRLLVSPGCFEFKP